MCTKGVPNLAQGAVLVGFGAWGLTLWGVPPGSPLRGDALNFLHIRALGAPATILLMVAQARARACMHA
jgi:hypothetical protein